MLFTVHTWQMSRGVGVGGDCPPVLSKNPKQTAQDSESDNLFCSEGFDTLPKFTVKFQNLNLLHETVTPRNCCRGKKKFLK